MPSTGTPCGDEVSGSNQREMGAAFSQHLNSCAKCQQIQEDIRREWFGENTKDPRD